MENLPQYSEVARTPNQGRPKRLIERETSAEFSAECQAAARELLAPDARPQDDAPLFVTIVNGDGGPLTATQPDGRSCVTVFSSPFRAADYQRALLTGFDDAQFLVSTPEMMAKMLADLRRLGVESICLDRCPRCKGFAVYSTEAMTTTNGVFSLWAIVKGTELTKVRLYSEFGRDLATKGKLQHARRLAMQTASHVTMEDPGLHLFIGQLAVARGDETEVAEAKAFLRYLGQQDFLEELAEFERNPPISS